MRRSFLLFILSCVVLLGALVRADPTPKYPLKNKRMLYSDDEIARIKENVATHPGAKAVANAIIKGADAWVDWPDADLRFLLTDANVPRAFAASASGCPVCGNKIKEKNG